VITPGSRPAAYRTLVLPDETLMDDATSAVVRSHVERGGAVLSTGWSGLDPARRDFALSAWGMRKTGEDPLPESGPDAANLHLTPYPAYFSVSGAVSRGLPAMPMNCYVRGVSAEALPGTEVLGRVISSFFPQHWDGEHHYLYIPPDAVTDRAFILRRGRVIQVTHPLFTAYYQFAPVPLKNLVANLLTLLNPRPVLRAENLPSFARVMVTAQPERHMVWVMGYVPERRGAAIDMIEEPVEMSGVRVGLQPRGRGVSRVLLARTGKELPLDLRDGYVTVSLPTVRGWELVVFED
jgi:hypothetical protein